MAVLGQCLSLGPMLVYTLGVFAKPLTTEFKTSRGAISLALTLTNLMSAVAALGAGWLVDRLGARRVITCSILAFTACLLALSRVTTSFGHFDVLYAMAGVLAVGATPVTYSRVLALNPPHASKIRGHISLDYTPHESPLARRGG